MFFYFQTLNVKSQLKDFGSNSKTQLQPRFKYEPYVFADLIKNFGIGIQHQINPYFSLDASLFLTYSNPLIDGMNEDYNDFKGFGISVCPKFHFSPAGSFYIGLYNSLESLQHGKTTTSIAYPLQHSQYYTVVSSSSGTALTLDLAFGKKYQINNKALEIYVMLGAMKFIKSESVYYSSTYNPDNLSFPYSKENTNLYADVRLGLKFCFGVKKIKRNTELDKKFDEDYIPRYNSLANYTYSLWKDKRSKTKQISSTYAKIRGTNKKMLRIYRRNYYDLEGMYKKMDLQIKMLEGMVENIKKSSEKTSE